MLGEGQKLLEQVDAGDPLGDVRAQQPCGPDDRLSVRVDERTGAHDAGQARVVGHEHDFGGVQYAVLSRHARVDELGDAGDRLLHRQGVDADAEQLDLGGSAHTAFFACAGVAGASRSPAGIVQAFDSPVTPATIAAGHERAPVEVQRMGWSAAGEVVGGERRDCARQAGAPGRLGRGGGSLTLAVRDSRPATATEWDALWAACPYATYFHSRAWSEDWSAYTAGSLVPAPVLVTFNDGRRALLPITRQLRRRGLAVRYLLSPAGTYGGWLADQPLEAAHAELLTAWLLRKRVPLWWRVNPFDPLAAVPGPAERPSPM